LRVVDIIRAKRDGQALSLAAIESFIQGISDGSWADYQTSALLMAIVLRGMSAEETSWLTEAMVRSGRRVDLSSIPGIKVGKHSTGGVGDKVSIVLAPLAAACGVVVPKMSGRGLGHTGGTLDKLQAIPGYRVDLSLDEFIEILRDVGCCLISQTKDIAPADKRLYALRDVTATIESIPLISASVMSKKLAEGSNAVVLDVKCGSGAFMKRLDDALALARSLVSIGESHGVRTEAFITNMDSPLGTAVGNALEIAECIQTLKGEGPADLQALILRLGARMVQLADRARGDAEAEACVRDALQSGAALRKFAAMVVRQGGDAGIIDNPGRMPQAQRRQAIEAPTFGFILRIDAEAVGRAAVMLGAGRDRVDAPIDLAAGVVLLKKPGDAVAQGDRVLDLHYNDSQRLDQALELARSAIEIGAARAPAAPLVLGWVHAHGETSYV
jgi:pyrimidine-nucleoside phosphorylase/thymidine phosphorylase